MTFYLSIRKEAESDIAEAYQYYEGCRENLAQIVHSGKIETDLHTSWKISNCHTNACSQTKWTLRAHFPADVSVMLPGSLDA